MLKKITPGSTIAVVAPAFPPDKKKIRKGIEYLEKKGFVIKQAPSLSGQYGYLSGTDEQRAKELDDCFADHEIDAIFCARGGWGTLRLLDKLNYDIIKSNPKLLLGYSDITTLQLAIWKKCKIPSISGPMVAVEMSNSIPDFTENHFWRQLENQDHNYKIDLSSLENIEYLKNGSCSGTLLGGCLSMVAHQLGTPFSPDYSGSILFLEDVGEKPYKIDRYLAQLKQAGIFRQINGLIIGEFIDCEDNGASFSVKELIGQYSEDAGYPVIFNFPYGHQVKKISIPIGMQSKINTTENFMEIKNPFFSSANFAF